MSGTCNLPVELEYLYNAADRLYVDFARSCGISNCAYWMLYELERAGARHLCAPSTWTGAIASRL